MPENAHLSMPEKEFAPIVILRLEFPNVKVWG